MKPWNHETHHSPRELTKTNGTNGTQLLVSSGQSSIFTKMVTFWGYCPWSKSIYIYTHTLHLAGGELCYVDFPTYPLCFWDLVGLGRPCELTIHHEEDRHMFPVDTPLWIITDVRHLCLSENKVLQKCLLIKPCYFPIWWIYPQFLDNSKYHIVGEYLNTPSYPIISRQDKLPPSGASPQRHMQIKGAMSRMRRGLQRLSFSGGTRGLWPRSSDHFPMGISEG